MATFILLWGCANSSSVIFLSLYPHIFHFCIHLITDLIIMQAALTLWLLIVWALEPDYIGWKPISCTQYCVTWGITGCSLQTSLLHNRDYNNTCLIEKLLDLYEFMHVMLLDQNSSRIVAITTAHTRLLFFFLLLNYFKQFPKISKQSHLAF